MPSATHPAPSTTAPVAAATALLFRGLRSPVEVFKAGTHTDSEGRAGTFTRADLDQMVANVTGAGVPAVLGHPKDNDPAYAWAQLRRDGDLLLAEFSDINADFEAAVDAGAYRNRSVAVYHDAQRGWVVQHIGWLGAVPPALALAPLQYSGGALPAAPAGAQLHCYSAGEIATGWALGDVARLMRGLRDWLISDKGLDVADKVLPDWSITSVSDAARRAVEATAAEVAPNPAAFAAHTPAGITMPQPITEEEAQRLRDQAAQAETLQSQFAAQGAELAELRAQRQAERIGVQINGWKAAGLLTPAEEPGLAQFMAALESGQAVQFAFSGPAPGQQVQQTPAEWFAAFMGTRRPIRLGQSALGEEPAAQLDTQDARAISRAAQEFMHAEAQAGRVVNVAQAVAHVTTAGQAKA